MSNVNLTTLNHHIGLEWKVLGNRRTIKEFGRVRRQCLLLCFLILSTLVAILGTSVPSAIPSSAAQIGATHHSWGPSRPDKAGETVYDGPYLNDASALSFFLPDLRLESDDSSSLQVPVAKQLPGQLRANYFRPPPTL